MNTPASNGRPYTKPRVLCYSSGAWPCGIANYHNNLTPSLRRHCHPTTVTLPTAQILRDKPLALWQQYRTYRRLAALSDCYDAILLQFITAWNGQRVGENTLPVFIERLRRPTVVVLHEWPPDLEPESSTHRIHRRFIEALTRTGVLGPSDFPSWLRDVFLRRAEHFFVHSPELQDRLLAQGVQTSRITLVVPPIYHLSSHSHGPDLHADITRRLAGKRVLLLFGFPHPRKHYELAIHALRMLPDNTILVMAGATHGRFRESYTRHLLSLASHQGVTHRFVVTGELGARALGSLLALASLGVAPFSYATGSSSLGYLIGSGLPIVASDISSNIALKNAGAGLWLFRQNDATDLARVIQILLSDRAQHGALQELNATFSRIHTFGRLGALVSAQLRAVSFPSAPPFDSDERLTAHRAETNYTEHSL